MRVSDYISGEIEATIEAFAFVARLSKLAMRNWILLIDKHPGPPGTNIVTISIIDNITVGMKVSAGKAFADGTKVAEIIDGRTIRVSANALPLVANSLGTIDTDTTTTSDVNSATSIGTDC